MICVFCVSWGGGSFAENQKQNKTRKENKQQKQNIELKTPPFVFQRLIRIQKKVG